MLSFGGGGDEAFGEVEVDLFLAMGVARSDFDEAIANAPDVIGRGALGCERKIGFLVLMVPEVNANGGFAHWFRWLLAPFCSGRYVREDYQGERGIRNSLKW